MSVIYLLIAVSILSQIGFIIAEYAVKSANMTMTIPSSMFLMMKRQKQKENTKQQKNLIYGNAAVLLRQQNCKEIHLCYDPSGSSRYC
jgi:hypothetical protein